MNESQTNAVWTGSPDPFRPPKSARSPALTIFIVVAVVAIPLALYLAGARLTFERPRSEVPGNAAARPAVPSPQPEMRPELPPRAQPYVAPSERLAESPSRPTTREIYLCKGYTGGMFWSSALCSTQRATIDRIVTVPSHYSWEQAVAAGERELRAVDSLYGPREHPVVVSSGRNAKAQRSTECAFLKRQIEQIDAAARQPQSGATQDRLRSERQRVRAREAELRC